jgi:hypothetical protein
MPFRELAELKEKLSNTAHSSAIMHTVEIDGGRELDHSQK